MVILIILITRPWFIPEILLIGSQNIVCGLWLIKHWSDTNLSFATWINGNMKWRKLLRNCMRLLSNFASSTWQRAAATKRMTYAVESFYTRYTLETRSQLSDRCVIISRWTSRTHSTTYWEIVTSFAHSHWYIVCKTCCAGWFWKKYTSIRHCNNK